MKSYDVLCAGILVADLFTSPMQTMLKPGELSLVDDILLESGGCASNVAVNLSKLGLRSTVLGKVGNDVFGHAVINELKQRGLETGSIIITDTATTSRTVVLIVKDEDRRYIHTKGANADFTAFDIDSQLVSDSKVLYVGGYLAMDCLDGEELSHVFRSAREAGTRTILDVVVPVGSQIDHAGLAKLMPYTDVFLPNSDEAAAISGLEDPIDQAKYFNRLGVGCVAITCGAEGSVTLKSDVIIQADVFPIECIDASGGGDGFTSGFILGVLNGWELSQTIEFASAMGASACQMRGCTTGTFTIPQANDFLSNNKLKWHLI
jgi:sugar/nucleoside kinase (ribokinase family)